MAKEYFSHDHNARHDRKIVALIKEYKSSGYGIFWATCEMMHEEGGSLEFDELTFGAISKDLNEDESLIKEVLDKCVLVYKLFKKDEENIVSGRVNRNLTEIHEKKLVKIQAGRLGGIKSGESRRTKQNEATLKANEAELEATNQIKLNKTKVKESKESTKVVDAEKEINNNFFEFFRRSAGSHISDSELRHEVGRFRNKYPNIHANQSGGLINAWVANIGKEKPVEKKMVL